MELRAHHAVVACGGSGRWKVGYGRLEALEPVATAGTLARVQALAHSLLDEHKKRNGLGNQWSFAFSLTARRAAACHFREQRIYLAAGHCLRADTAEIRNTLLHEIAHAIAGPEHHHNAHWKRIAKSIGCTGDRCTAVRHAGGRWVARCRCGMVYRRMRRSRRMQDSLCSKCRTRLSWKTDTEGEGLT